MKRKIILAQLCLLFALVMLPISASSKERILFVYYNDYPPFGWEENNKMQGIYIDIVNEVFTHRLKIPAEHRGYPWKRAQQMVKDGKADGFCTVITPERLRFSDATRESILDVNFKIFIAANSPKLEQLKQISSISELQSFELADYLGSGWAVEHLEKAGLDIQWLPLNEQLWKFLSIGRADATVKNEWTTRYTLKKLGYQDQILELPHPMTPEPISFNILIGKKSSFQSSLGQVDTELKQMKKDGTLQRIYDKYK